MKTRSFVPWAVVGLVSASAALLAAPARVGESSGSVAGIEAPEGTEISAGDGKVSSQTGSFGYSIPIAVPPGRLGAEPSLALSYSSQAPLYGGIAAGWTLSVPTITRDFSEGPKTPVRWVSSLTGRELVPVDEPAPPGQVSFRSKSDPGYARYQRRTSDGAWRVLQADGSTLFFNEVLQSSNAARIRFRLIRSADRFGNEVHYTWDRLDPAVLANEARLLRIDYTINSAVNGGAPHAQVELSYGAPRVCAVGVAAVGAKVSYRSGEKQVMGSAPLTSITTRVDDGSGFRDVRRYDFEYAAAAASCDPASRTDDSPIRLLTRVTESARSPEGVWSTLPPLTFAYGSANSAFIRTGPVLGGTAGRASGGSAASIVAAAAAQGPLPLLPAGPAQPWPVAHTLGDVPRTLLRDMDGDGLLDLLYSAEPSAAVRAVDSRCYIGWRKGLGLRPSHPLFADSPLVPVFGAETLVPMPTVPWQSWDGLMSVSLKVHPSHPDDLGIRGAGEVCTVVGQHTMDRHRQRLGELKPVPKAYLGAIVVYSFEDHDGDGLVDLAVGMEADGRFYDPQNKGLFTCTGSASFAGLAANRALSREDFRQKCVDANFTEHQCDACLEEARENDGQHSCHRPAAQQWPDPPWADPPPGPRPDLSKPRVEAAIILSSVAACGGPGGSGWNLYLNDGTGRFGPLGRTATTSASFSSEVPVAKAAGARTRWETLDLALSVGVQPRAIADLDGDGLPDIAALDKFRPNERGADWRLTRHDLDLGLGRLATDPESWATEKDEGVTPMYPGYATFLSTPPFWSRTELRRLLDVHGDGIADFVGIADLFSGPSGSLVVRPGRGFADAKGTAFLSQARSSEPFDAVSVVEIIEGPAGTFDRNEVRGFVDLDSDGRLDTFDRTTARIFYNVGDGFIAGAARFFKPQRTVTTTDGWAVLRDHVDFNGDGLPELIELDDRGEPRIFLRTLATHGARRGILHRVDNGRGLTLDVKYAPHTRASVVTMGSGRLPAPTWVVSSVTTTHAHGGAPVSTTRYRYHEPVWSQDENDRWGFRGFKSVVVTGPSGATTEERYDYVVDWSGRRAATLAYERGRTDPNRFSETVWSAFQTLGVTSFHAAQTTEYICQLESDGVVSTLPEADCKTRTTPLTQRTYFAAIVGPKGSNPSFGQDVAYMPSADLRGELDAGGSRFVDAFCSSSSYEKRYSASDYRIVATRRADFAGTIDTPQVGQTLSSAGCAGGAVAGTSQTTYDATLKAPLHACSIRRVGETPVPGSGVCTRTDVDLTTGLTRRRQSPQGFADDHAAGVDWVTGVTTTTYDRSGLFPVRVRNALGHTVTLTTDLATGVQLSSHGPNANQGGYRQIDGFGRTLHEWLSIRNDPDPNQPYHYRRVRDIVYGDSASPQTLTERSTRLLSADNTLATNNNSLWAEIKTTYDGAGRVIEVHEAALEAPVEDPSTRTYVYDASGNLERVTVPDPSKDKFVPGDVTYVFEVDSLSRPTCSLAPDGSGVATVHAGRRVKTFEFGSDGGDCADPTDTSITTPRSASRVERDVRGRVVTVEERVDAIADTWSTTRYSYDGNSNLHTVTREDFANRDVVTTLTHDLRGHRTRIDRHGRTWSYTYDHDGNLLTQVSPLASSGGDFTLVMRYDELGRLTSRIVPGGGLGLVERARLGVGETTMEYDQGLHGLGKLTRKTTPLETIDYTYDARGNLATTTRKIDLSDASGANVPLTDTLVLTNLSWNAFNQPATVIYPSGRRTYTHYHRWPSVPRHVYIFRDDGDNEFFINSRNAAGVAKTLLHQKAGHFGRRVSSTHNLLGHLTRETSGDVGDQRISQRMTYGGTGEVATLESRVGPVAGRRNFTFSYDDQHQLTAASDDRGYASAFTYTPTGRLTRARVTAAAGAGTLVEDRNVTYAYGDADPEIVTALIDDVVAPLGLGATYAYDAAGNMTRREVSGGSGGAASVTVDLLYDAENRLRIRRLPDGSEERYFYDGPDRWLAVQVESTGTAVGARLWFGGEEIEYACSPTQCVRKTEKTYIRLGSRTVARLERDAVTGAVESKLVHSDRLGHTLGVYAYSLDANDLEYDLELGFQYGPFGEILDTFEAAGADADDYRERFNGKEFDLSSGLSYYGYRYFDPLALIWNRSDPLYRFAPDYAVAEPRRGNLYTFSGNNPKRYFDPDGRDKADALTIRILLHPATALAREFKRGQRSYAMRDFTKGVDAAAARTQRIIGRPVVVAVSVGDTSILAGKKVGGRGKVAGTTNYVFILPKSDKSLALKEAARGVAAVAPGEAGFIKRRSAEIATKVTEGKGMTAFRGAAVGFLTDTPSGTVTFEKGIHHEGLAHPAGEEDVDGKSPHAGYPIMMQGHGLAVSDSHAKKIKDDTDKRFRCSGQPEASCAE